MLASDIPAKFPIPFASSAVAPYIRQVPEASQIGIQAGAASLTDGYPPDTFVQIASGGTPPFGADTNGILNQATAWDRWLAAGGPIPWDSAFATAIGGYPKGAVVAALDAGYLWLSKKDNNLSNPDSGGTADWQAVSLAGGTNTTGDWKFRPTAEVLDGWVMANATTIGSATSNATQRANADTFRLYFWIWTNFSNARCPVYTSGGVSTSRGASAAADFAANKAIATPDWRGAGPMGVDNMGGAPTSYLLNVPFSFGSQTIPGSLMGENTHQLTVSEMAVHSHGITDVQHSHTYIDPSHDHGLPVPVQAGPLAPPAANTGVEQGGTGTRVTASFIGITINSSFTGITGTNNTGGDAAHNTVQRSYGVTWYIKL